ncbi:iron complex transport system substrate-binding protein [Peribacillus deserti]|uniref:Iron complex transport system substrate-binding protein n=1 Tax=Peribacillus deserti TaxID=673318 RepID=A0ABS2QQ91_9BACI|nr:cobalamin-binding protein [Peribacillus deserti]MBM7694421.1 iron complex transport system substrate-binding protein [Peribacillus deserti]
MRLISICPSNTELCVFLGIENQLIAVDDFSDWPASIMNLPRLGPDLSIDMDLTESLKPDLVLASLSVPGMEKNIEELQKRNIPHVILNPQSLADISEDLLKIGRLLGIERTAAERIRVYQSLINSIKEISKTITERPSLYWEWWPKPIFTPGKINWLTEISRLAGAENVFQDVELASVQTSEADVAERNPDVICLAWVGVPLKKVQPGIVKKRPGWENLKAVKNNHILVLEEPLYCRPSPRLLNGLINLAKTLHPEAYRDIHSDGLWL